MFYASHLLLAASLGLSSRSLLINSAPTDSGDVVGLGYAQYQGNRSFEDTVAYLGIPYAEPPLGDRRFRAPLPLNTSRVSAEAGGQVIDATQNPDFCIQGTIGSGDAGGAGSEDCLNVNVWAPYGAKSGDNLPVLVYFHGGGYVYGNPANFPFDHWVHQSPNVVIVTVYYRLDSLGFLNIPEFSDSTNGDFNAGFQDQIQSLKWVKEYISSFGGDPDQVTINGQSAGGGSVELHLVANAGETLFSKAIAQSVDRAVVSLPEQKSVMFEFYADSAGCGDGSVPDKLACLRNASISALAIAQDAVTYSFNGSYASFNPSVDGTIITDYPSVSILKGKFAQVPLIVGSTSNETVIFADNFTAALASVGNFWPGLSSEDLNEFAENYPRSDFSSDDEQIRTLGGETLFRCARAILGGAFSNATGKAWTYRYNQENPTVGSGAVEHAAENWMMFNGINTSVNGTGTFTALNDVEQAFAEELIAYWLSFVRSGDPNTYKLDQSPVWEEYSATTEIPKLRIVLQQDPNNSTTASGSFIEMEPERESERCEFVASKATQMQD